MPFYQRLIDYSRSLSRQHASNSLPIVVAFVINHTTQELLDLEVPGCDVPFAKMLPSVGWARLCLFFNSGSMAPHLENDPLHPFIALAHCLIEQKASLFDIARNSDPTIKRLYGIMKRILTEQVPRKERATQLFQEVCVRSLSEFRRTKEALEDEGLDADGRVKTGISIVDNAIAYLDEVAQESRLDEPMSDFAFAANGQIPWKTMFDQWKTQGRFLSYNTYKSAQSAYHRSKKQKLNHQQPE